MLGLDRNRRSDTLVIDLDRGGRLLGLDRNRRSDTLPPLLCLPDLCWGLTGIAAQIHYARVSARVIFGLGLDRNRRSDTLKSKVLPAETELGLDRNRRSDTLFF